MVICTSSSIKATRSCCGFLSVSRGKRCSSNMETGATATLPRFPRCSQAASSSIEPYLALSKIGAGEDARSPFAHHVHCCNSTTPPQPTARPFLVTATHDFPFTVNESDFLQLFIRKRLECAISDGIGFHAKRDDISCICLGVFGDFEKHGETKKRMAYTL
jgi:hypothetical protein